MSGGQKTERRKPRKTRRSRISWTRIAATGAAVLLMVLALLLHSGGDSQRQERYFRLATEYYQKGEYDLALSNLRKAGEISSSEEQLMLMADCYQSQGNWDAALSVMRKLDLNDPAVADRIAFLEQQKNTQQDENRITIAGDHYDPATTKLDLRGRGLVDNVLQELLQLYALSQLDLADNAISDPTPLASLEGLRELDLSGNQISDVLALAKLKNLRSLCLDKNPLTDLRPLYSLTELEELSLLGVKLPEGAVEALSLALPGCAILADGDLEGTQNILLSGVRFSPDVTDLDLSGKELRSIACLSRCKELRKLVLTDNEISDLRPLMDLQKLETLRVAGNQISDLRPLMAMSSLRLLDASRNNVSETSALAYLEKLQNLDLSDNPIGDFGGLKNLKNLEILRLENTGVTDEALPSFYGLQKLGILALEGNQGITADAMKVLKTQLPANCAVVHGSLVLIISLGGEDFRTDVTSLRLERTELASLYGLEKFDCLETVYLARNHIEDLSAFQNSHSRESIKILDLSFNRIEELSPLTSLKSLETLDLSYNRIMSLGPLMRMTQLKKLDLSGNPLQSEQIEELRQALPDCEIIFYFSTEEN